MTRRAFHDRRSRARLLACAALVLLAAARVEAEDGADEGDPAASPEAAREGASPAPALPDWLAADAEDAKLSLPPDELEEACRNRTFAADTGLPCAQLALRHLTGDEVAVDPAESATLARRACKLESPLGCALLGWMLEEGVGVPRDADEALKAYRGSCRLSDSHPHGGGCFRLAKRLSEPGGDAAAAARALRASCAAQFQRACDGAYAARETRDADTPRDARDDALAVLRRRCDAGDGATCARLGDQAASGAGVELSFPEAAAFYRKACRATRSDAGACASLGALHAEGNGVERDLDEARRLLDVACKADVKSACARLASMRDPKAQRDLDAWCREGDPSCGGAQGESASSDGAAACDRGDADACAKLGLALLKRGPDRDLRRAAAVLRKACDAGNADGCGGLAWQHGTGMGVPRRDRAQAAKLDERACDGGVLGSCAALAWSLTLGVDTNNGPRALELALRACDGGAPNGCWVAGFILGASGVVPRDSARAARFYDRGCKGGDPTACAAFAIALTTGEGIARDRPRGLELARTICKSDANGCWVVGVLLGDSQDPAERAEGREALQEACRQGHEASCRKLRQQ
jgi:TPR repeat protein